MPRPGPASPHWVGDACTYSGAHQRTRAARGSARDHPCVDCGDRASDWSYTFSAGERELMDDRGLRYSPDPEHYAPRCRPCHGALDAPGQQSCVVDGCDRPRHGQGLCDLHYQRAHRRGELPGRTSRPCSEPDYPRPHKSRGLCDTHYRRLLRTGGS